MAVASSGKRLSIYVGESDTWQGHLLYMRILETLRKAGLAGATVTRGLAGFGAHSRIRSSNIEVLSTDLPIIITVIESPENIQKALSLVGPMVREGLITLEDVAIIKYTHRYLNPLPADLPLSQIMTREVTAVAPDTPVVQVMELLLGKGFKVVPVLDGERRVVGIITEGDLLKKAGMPVRLSVSQRLGPEDLRGILSEISREKTAGAIMTSPVVIAHENEALAHVAHRLLERGLKRMPVVNDQGRIVGMISRLDVLRAVAGSNQRQPEQSPLPHRGQTIGDCMVTVVPTVHIHEDLADVLEKMLGAALKRVVVVDEQERPAGVITEGDLVVRVSPAERPRILQMLGSRIAGTARGQITARELMSEKALSAPPHMTVTEAISLLLREGRKQIIVVDDQERIVGMVDRQMLMAACMGG